MGGPIKLAAHRRPFEGDYSIQLFEGDYPKEWFPRYFWRGAHDVFGVVHTICFGVAHTIFVGVPHAIFVGVAHTIFFGVLHMIFVGVAHHSPLHNA
jgi:hypothetical protein